jgi:hypothetical protein
MAISLTYTFSAGTRILSSQVNANFSTLASRALDKTGDTMTGSLLFTDATYDIGASGATRPRDLFLSRNATIGGTLAVTGVATLSASTIGLRGVTYTLPSADGSNGAALTTNGSATLSWSSVNSKPFIQWSALQNQPPAVNYATPDTRNNHAVLDFDAGTDEYAFFVGALPASYAGGGLTVDIYWTATSATSGNCMWEAAIERYTTDLDSDSFATAQATTSATSGTSGIITKTTITLTSGAQMDSLAAGEAFRLQIMRNANNAADTMTGDAELHCVTMRET